MNYINLITCYQTRQWVDELAQSGRRVLDLKSDNERRFNGVHDDIAMSHLVHELKVNYGVSCSTVTIL